LHLPADVIHVTEPRAYLIDEVVGHDVVVIDERDVVRRGLIDQVLAYLGQRSLAVVVQRADAHGAVVSLGLRQ
jgi:hypothetical protein